MFDKKAYMREWRRRMSPTQKLAQSIRMVGWRSENRERIAEAAGKRAMAWKTANLERRLEWERQYRATSEHYRLQHIVYAQRRRARQRKAEGTFGIEDIERILRLQDERCFYCNEESPMTVDHVVPLVRGGSNWPTNIVMACHPCNASKGDKLVEEWGGRHF